MVKLTSVKVTYEDINCIKYRRIIYMSWDNMLGMYGSALSFYLHEEQFDSNSFDDNIVQETKLILAHLGGIFGLCLGGSFISLFEIVYFLLIRIVGTIALKYSKREEAAKSAPKVFIVPSSIDKPNKVVHFKDSNNHNYASQALAHTPAEHVDFQKI